MLKRSLALLLLAPLIFAADTPQSSNDRLLALGKLWVTIKYFHPYLAYRDIDWDTALVNALPKIEQASDPSSYATAVQSMLDALHDPSTYVLPGAAAQHATALTYARQPDGTLIISQTAATSESPSDAQFEQEVKQARGVVFDLRDGDLLAAVIDRNASNLVARSVETPGQRTWVHNGLAPESGAGFEGFHSAFYVKPGQRVAGSAASNGRFAFVLGENSKLPAIATALVATANAVAVSESPHYQAGRIENIIIPLGMGVNAIVRLSEDVFADGSGSPAIPVVAPGAGIASALASLSQPPSGPPKDMLPPYPIHRSDVAAYPNAPYPAREYRILAAYKIWAAFRYFFAYRDLMDEDWDDVFTTFLPRFVAAANARDYNLAIAEMLTHTADSNVTIASKEMAEYFGPASVGLRLRIVERKPIITEVLDPDATQAGVRVGDIVSSVDGEPIRDRFQQQAKYVAASTQQSLGSEVIQRILNGPDDSVATLKISGAGGSTREIKLRRTLAYTAALASIPTGHAFKMLPGNIGYADLRRLTPDEVAAMFDQLHDAAAIIFDARGATRGAAWQIAPRLSQENDSPAAIITGPLALTPDLTKAGALTSTASYFFVQTLPASTEPKYKGKTLLLVDERTTGDAEHAGLLLEAANKTEFIGTPSAGADADATNFAVPGGITITLSGDDVRHANGGKLQRLGLQPAATVAPTIAGIRAGQDEVLDKALEYLSSSQRRSFAFLSRP